MISTLLPKKMTARVDNPEFTTIFPMARGQARSRTTIFPMARGQARDGPNSTSVLPFFFWAKNANAPRPRNAHRIFAADVVKSSKSDGKVTKVVEFSRSISHTPPPRFGCRGGTKSETP